MLRDDVMLLHVVLGKIVELIGRCIREWLAFGVEGIVDEGGFVVGGVAGAAGLEFAAGGDAAGPFGRE